MKVLNEIIKQKQKPLKQNQLKFLMNREKAD